MKMIEEFHKVLRTPKPSTAHTLGKTQDLVRLILHRFYAHSNKYSHKLSIFNSFTTFTNKC